MRPQLVLLSVLVLFLAGCSTLKGWFTPQGQLLSQASASEKSGDSLAASALAAEALSIDPEYKEALTVLRRNFEQGQRQFASGLKNLNESRADNRWDRLYALLTWQDSLALHGPAVGPEYAVEGVGDLLREAGDHAAEYHLTRAKALLDAVPGPRQARKALAEGRTAFGYGTAEGLQAWLQTAEDAATQKVMVIPFYYDGPRNLSVSGPLASLISRLLLEGELPPLTTVFPSDRLVTLQGGGLARAGLISQPEALVLAVTADQNIVLMGQIVKTDYQRPTSSSTSVTRELSLTVVDTDHPGGVTKLYKAVLTKTVWKTSAALSASVNLIEAATKHDLLSTVVETRASDEVTLTTFTGDREALNADDLKAVNWREPLVDPDTLWTRTMTSLAAKVREAVVKALE